MSNRSRKAAGLVGVRELKTHAAGIVQQVREARASYIITHRGEPVGMILPLDPAESVSQAHDDADGSNAWETFVSAGRRIERRFRRDANGVDILSRMRR